jgi:hypothetical protein
MPTTPASRISELSSPSVPTTAAGPVGTYMLSGAAIRLHHADRKPKHIAQSAETIGRLPPEVHRVVSEIPLPWRQGYLPVGVSNPRVLFFTSQSAMLPRVGGAGLFPRKVHKFAPARWIVLAAQISGATP